MYEGSFFVYLIGPVKGCSYDTATNWRDEVVKMFPSEITVLSPMRGKDFLRGTAHLDIQSQVVAHDIVARHLTTPRGITLRDRFDVMRADAVLGNFLGADKISIGSIFEIAWADLCKIPIILAMEDRGNQHEHPMVRECAWHIFPELEQAVRCVSGILLP